MASLAAIPSTVHNGQGASQPHGHELTHHPRFQDILDLMTKRARTAMPSAGDRIDKARELVLGGHVTPQDNYVFKVRSYSRPEIAYLINGNCRCEESVFTPGSWCLPNIAIGLYRRTRGALQTLEPEAAATPDPAQPTVEACTPAQGTSCHPQPVPQLPEAPASVNVRLVLHGRDCQMTLRDSDEGRLLDRLAALLQRFPVEASPAPVAESPVVASVPPAGWCGVHRVQMRLNEKEGRVWYSHKTTEGWCKGQSY
jgi:hypothetical protein